VRLVVVVVALALCALLVRAFVAEPFAIPSESMEPTLQPGDHVLVDKLAFRFGHVHRGDLVVFRAPEGGAVALKRIVGLGGDRVAIEDGVLSVNGRLERESFVDYPSVDSVYFGPVIVPAGSVFLIGDNRADSRDSRDYGPVREGDLIGRVLVRVWPLTR
jgi:signal peptidase I